MKNAFVFASVCPVCRQRRSQHGHTRRDLMRLIEASQIIDAYCLECDIVWPVSIHERVLIACAIAVRNKRHIDTGENGSAPDSCPTEWTARFVAVRPRQIAAEQRPGNAFERKGAQS
jgi:hypothetical protein